MYFFIRLFGICLTVRLAYASAAKEPRCYSRFDWEDKLLDKTIRTEIKMEEYMEKLDGALETIRVRKEEIDEIRNSIDKKLEEFMNQSDAKTKQAVADIQSVQEPSKTPTISFNAREAADTSPNKNQVIVFQSVIHNFGNAYDVTAGIFTAPVTGLYLFSVQICTYYSNHGRFQAVVDRSANVILAIQEYDSSHHTSTSNTVSQYLTEGQRVWVQASYGSTNLFEDAECWNQFSGCLVHA